MAWRIVNARFLDRQISDFSRKAEYYASPSMSFEQCETFVKDFEAFQKIRAAVDELRRGNPSDPTSKLKYFSTDDDNNSYYALVCGRWVAYYLVNLPAKTAVALFFVHKEALAADILDLLRKAMGPDGP
ncbi:MAG: hypothetical protein JO076_04340 [Verrucomicrobia bacterium]|nr:hypothetical protein [Verrucomicrobiota bacterium]